MKIIRIDPNKKNKVVFFGTPEFVIPVLQALLDTKNLSLVAVVTSPDKPASRKQISTPAPVKSWAQEHKIKVIDSNIMIRIIRAVKDLAPDVCILAAYGKIIPPELLNIPKYSFLNIHPSLLPKYRGASPVQAAILNGEAETGVTIIKMDEKVDHGPIVAQTTEEVKPNDTAKSLYERLFAIGTQVLLTILPAYLEGRIEFREQNHRKATYARKLTRDDGKIDWSKPDSFNERFIRAMYPWPGAFTNVKLKMKNEKLTKRLKILKAHLENGKLVLDLVQLEGKKPVSWKEFRRGYPKFTF